MKTLLRIVLIVVLMMLITSCASRYLPVGGEGLMVVNDAYLYQDNKAEVVAQNRYWVREPQNLNDYFTTFYVTVKNRSGKKLDVQSSDFALLDQDGNQSDPLSVDQIENILLHNELQYLVIKNIEEQDDRKMVTINDQTDTLEQWRRSKRNLISDSFTFGDIFPNAKRTGYLFFPKVNIKNDELTLIYKTQQMKFRR